MQKITLRLLSVFLCLSTVLSHAEEKANFRTDANQDKSLPWFQLVHGEFPPKDSSHYISGELIGVDHLERTITIRGDRNDNQERALMDYPIEAAMLPYSTIYYHNSLAALQDIPLGTHLHGWFYQRTEENRFWGLRNEKPHAKNGQRASIEVDFTRCVCLQDDFTYYARRKQIWKISKVEPFRPDDEKDLSHRIIVKKLTATLQEDGKSSGKPRIFDLTASTNVFQDNGFAAITDIKPGQLVQMNLTWATLFGAGRVTDIWLDDVSRTEATARQLQRHHQHIRQRGLPGMVSAVDDKERIVTIAFFDCVSPVLFNELSHPNPRPLGWPTKEYDWGNVAPKGNIIVVRECLMSYDQVNDRKGGNIMKVSKVPMQPGLSGVEIQVQCGILLEGFRPNKTVRFFPATWSVGSLPKEERYHGRE